MRILVTGGAGFVGSTLVHRLLDEGHDVCNLDAMTYAAQLDSLDSIAKHPRYEFYWASITGADEQAGLVGSFRPQAIMLQLATQYWSQLKQPEQQAFRFLHVSTDEVSGDLPIDAPIHGVQSVCAQLALLGQQGRQ